MSACLWWLCGTAIQVLTRSIGQLIAGRIINGICVGITDSQVSVYLAEIANKKTSVAPSLSFSNWLSSSEF
jgi:MFS family permease